MLLLLTFFFGGGSWHLGGAIPRLRSGAAAERNNPVSEVSGGKEETPRVRGQGSGQEELPHVRGQWRLRGDTPRPRSGEDRRSHLVPKARGSDLEEPPRARGQGQQLGGATQA